MEPYDYLLVVVGTISAIITGVTTPVFNLLLGKVIDALNKSPDTFGSEVNTLCIYFTIVACFNIVAGFLQVMSDYGVKLPLYPILCYF